MEQKCKIVEKMLQKNNALFVWKIVIL